MAGKSSGLLINDQDNVAVVLDEYVFSKEESEIYNKGGDFLFALKAQNKIPFAHKMAIRGIRKGEAIVKYGEEIGKALEDIQAGEWVHTHNLYCERGYGDGSGEE